MCLYIYICIYLKETRIYIYIYVYIYIYIYICVYTYIHTYIYIYTHLSTYLCIHIYGLREAILVRYVGDQAKVENSLAYTGLSRMNIDIPSSTQVIMMISPSNKGTYQTLTWLGYIY